MQTIPDLVKLVPSLLTLVEKAAAGILEVYDNPVEVFTKEDGSPVTQADHCSHRILQEGLEQLTPTISIISEEDAASWTLQSPFYWLIDPLDGTKGFIHKNGEFCINVALMKGQRPFLGLIHIPLTHETFYGYQGQAWRYAAGNLNAIHTRSPLPQGLTLLSGSTEKTILKQVSPFLVNQKVIQSKTMHSAIKFCLIAKGEADFYFRFEECCEWDTAAGHALVEAAGGSMTNLDGSPFLYGKPGLRNYAFVVSGQKHSYTDNDSLSHNL